MATTLHLGVIDYPYTARQTATTEQIFRSLKRGKRMSRSAARASVTTGDVATFLEDRYHVMEVFVEDRSNVVAKQVEQSVKGMIENLVMGAPATANPWGDATGKIDDAFKRFLALRQVERAGIPGVPTKAALEGVSHRFKHPYAKGHPRRPSFIDTGEYQNSFKSWVD